MHHLILLQKLQLTANGSLIPQRGGPDQFNSGSRNGNPQHLGDVSLEENQIFRLYVHHVTHCVYFYCSPAESAIVPLWWNASPGCIRRPFEVLKIKVLARPVSCLEVHRQTDRQLFFDWRLYAAAELKRSETTSLTYCHPRNRDVQLPLLRDAEVIKTEGLAGLCTWLLSCHSQSHK